MALLFALAFLLPFAALAQSAQPRLEFEVASIRPSAPADTSIEAGMRIDGSQVRFTALSLRECMRIAYQLKNYQFSGPDWIVSDRFNITAKHPPGATQDQVREMLQNLLLDRFNMTIHREKRDFPVYALTLSKAGLKLKETPTDASSPSDPAQKPMLDVKARGSEAGVAADLGNGAFFTFSDNRLIGHKLTMTRIADLLSAFMDKPVLDMTGLSATTAWELSLEITADDYRTMQMRAARNSGITLPAEAARLADLSTDSLNSAIEQAGLKIEARKAPLDIIVIDHAAKTPTEN